MLIWKIETEVSINAFRDYRFSISRLRVFEEPFILECNAMHMLFNKKFINNTVNYWNETNIIYYPFFLL